MHYIAGPYICTREPHFRTVVPADLPATNGARPSASTMLTRKLILGFSGHQRSFSGYQRVRRVTLWIWRHLKSQITRLCWVISLKLVARLLLSWQCCSRSCEIYAYMLFNEYSIRRHRTCARASAAFLQNYTCAIPNGNISLRWFNVRRIQHEHVFTSVFSPHK